MQLYLGRRLSPSSKTSGVGGESLENGGFTGDFYQTLKELSEIPLKYNKRAGEEAMPSNSSSEPSFVLIAASEMDATSKENYSSVLY